MELISLVILMLIAGVSSQWSGNSDEFSTEEVTTKSSWLPTTTGKNTGSHVTCAVPGVDYPDYKSLPKTNFSCSDKEYIPGFYADMETGCQVGRICTLSSNAAILCPTGTIFNQSSLLCDTWFKTNCSDSPMYYSSNTLFLSPDDFGPPSYKNMLPEGTKDFIMRIRKAVLTALLQKVESARLVLY